MKLRLPHKLQAALIAAFTAVAFTAPQAQASTASELNTALGELITLNNYMQGSDYTFSYTLTTVSTAGKTAPVLTLASDYHFNTQAGPYGGLSTAKSSVDGWPAPTSHPQEGLNIWTANNRVTGWISRDADGTGQSGTSLNGSTITVKYSASTNTTTFELYHKNKNTTDRVIMTGVALDANNFSFGEMTSAGTDLVFRSGKDYVWNGSTGNATWNIADNNWLDGDTDVAWTNGGNALFTTDAAEKTVTIGESVTANNVVVQDNYTFTMEGNTVNVTAGMTVASGKTLTLSGAGILTAGLLTGDGSITKAGDGTLNLGGKVNLGSLSVQAGDVNITGTANFTNALALTSAASPAAATIHVNNGGILTISNASTIGTKSLNNDNSNAFTNLFQGKAVDVQGTGKLIINGNIDTVDHNQGNQAYTSGLANLEILGNAKINTWASTNTTYNLGNHSIKTTGDLWFVTKQTLNITEGGNLEVGGKFKLGHDSNAGTNSSHLEATNATISLGGISMYGPNNSVSITGGNLTFNTASATDNVLSKAGGGDLASDPVTFTGVTLHSGTNGWTLAPVQNAAVNLAGATTVNVDEAKRISLTASTYGGTITKTGAGKLAFGSTATGSEGNITLSEGTLELTSGITTTGAFSVNGGTLVFAGANMLSAGSLSAAAGVTFDLNNIGTTQLGTIVLAAATGAATGDLSGVTVNWNLSSDYTYENLRVEDNKWVITLNSLGQNLTWVGGTGNWSYSPDDTPWLNAEQQAASFSNKDSAVFKAAGTPAVANLTRDITATNVVVENGANVTLQTSSDASLTATVLDIKGTLSTSVDVNATAVTITGAAATWNITDGAVTTDTITLTDNASLTLSGAGTVTANHGITAPDMTVTLASGIVLQGSSTDAFNLAGDGTYKLQSGSRSLGNVHLGDAEAWHGSVEIRGNVGGGHTFQGLSNVNSFVKLNGVTTWLQPNSTIAANLILVGPDEETHEGTALNINAADSNSSYTFSGSIQGTGDIEFSQTGADQGRSAAFHLKGDLDDWSGNFVNKNGGTQNGNWRNPSLYLDGNGSVHMGGGIVQKAGQLDVYLGGNNTTDVTVDGDVTREDGSLNLTANKATTFNGAVEASNLTVNADTTVNKGLHVSGATTVAEDTTLNVSNVGDTVSLSVGDVTLLTGSTMRVYEGDVFSEAAEAGLVIGDGHVLTAEVGATLYADLVMGGAEASPAVLDVSAMEGIGGLNMGSSVTLNPGNVALSSEDMALISGLEFGGMYDLFNGVDGFIVGENVYSQIGMSDAWVNAKDVFTDLVLPSEKDYYLFYSGANQGGVGSNVGTIYIMQMPEPTTGTLSLLALAALAARRRKH